MDEVPHKVAMSEKDTVPNNGAEPNKTETVLEMSGAERVFLAESMAIKARIDRIAQTTMAVNYLVAAGVVLLAVLVIRTGKVKPSDTIPS